MNTDLFKSFRGFLILGRCLGLIPIFGVYKRSYKDLKYSLWSLAGITSLICVLLLTFNAVLAIIDVVGAPKRNVSQIADILRNPMFALWGLFIYSYFLIRQQLFTDIFRVWAKCNSSLVYTQKDKLLKLTIILVSCFMFTSTVLENAILQLEFFVEFDDISANSSYDLGLHRNMPVLQMYYLHTHHNWSKLVGDHPVLQVLAFLNEKLILFGGNYTDVLMTLMARAVYFKFYALYKTGKAILVSRLPSQNKLQTKEYSILDQQAWDQLAKDHDSLCHVLNTMNRFFSPVIFVSYTINIYFFCIQLMYALNPDPNPHSIVHSIQIPWSFMHIILRIFLLSITMARVSEYAHKTRQIILRCPIKFYSDAIAKLDKLVTIGPKLGFSGLDSFTVTKPFMLYIVNVVFTFLIVLLQQGGSVSSPTSCRN